jgi:hypothetical protein
MGVTAFAADRSFAGVLPDGHLLAEVTRLAVSIGAALGVLAGAAFVLRIREFHLAIAAMTRRVQHDE